MLLFRWKMFCCFVLFGFLAAPASAQRLGQPFLAATVGGVGSPGSNYTDGDIFVRDLFVGAHVGNSFERGQYPGLTLGISGGETFAHLEDDSCIIAVGGTGGCQNQSRPSVRFGAFLAGAELRSSGGSLGFLLGPTALQSGMVRSGRPVTVTSFAVTSRLDAFVNLPSGHLSLGLSLRNMTAPNHGDGVLSLLSFGIGIRVQ